MQKLIKKKYHTLPQNRGWIMLKVWKALEVFISQYNLYLGGKEQFQDWGWKSTQWIWNTSKKNDTEMIVWYATEKFSHTIFLALCWVKGRGSIPGL